MKAEVCDVCLKNGKVNTAEEQVELSPYRNLKVNLCSECKDKVLKNRAEFIVYYCYIYDIAITKEEIEEILILEQEIEQYKNVSNHKLKIVKKGDGAR